MSSTQPLTLGDLKNLGVEVLKDVGDKRKAALETLGIISVLDLIQTYPRRWIDRTNEARISDIVLGVDSLVLVKIINVRSFRTKSRKMMVNVSTGDGSGKLSVTFFNQPWRAKQLETGMQVSVFGKPEMRNGYLQMTNPIVDLIGDRTGKIVPIYAQSEKVRIFTWHIAAWVEESLNRCVARGFAETLPQTVIKRLGLVGRSTAFRDIHMPESFVARDAARRRLAFDEVFRLQMVLVARKRALERELRGFQHRVTGSLIDRFTSTLPFPLTGAQLRVISEISDDLALACPMHRLLQGDVGSGKTIVAVHAMLCSVQGGHQAAIMAPTEVLAEQHASSIRQLLNGLQIPDDTNLFGDRPLCVELLTSRVIGEARRKILAGVADGTVDILIGTHALIQESVVFLSVGVVVIDEQHRFGVEQRAALRDKAINNPNGSMPDVLTMTATPIPRTAALTVYGDLDVSVLDELPPGRTPIATRWVNGGLAETAMWNDIRLRLADRQQAYVVCPLIDESEKLEVASAEKTFQELQKGELKSVRVGLLHGRMSSSEKEATMNSFRALEIDVLVATTVIEVGVDVPNATAMVVLDADRFGIAQLHQLRGRVGRGDISSECYLVTSTEEPGPRVEALVATTDGFELAEIDLDLRGEGAIKDTRQKGRSDLNLASLRRDRDLIELAREAAFEIVDADPLLTTHATLRDELELLLTEEEIEFLFKS
ncbi:MAG: ATP-dependent DNA helicase RecG [Ilumatobacteraceae bacterium]|nr:ATP-dependent DNA helicase RecG [Ilumatobacteraceae bacterium]